MEIAVLFSGLHQEKLAAEAFYNTEELSGRNFSSKFKVQNLYAFHLDPTPTHFFKAFKNFRTTVYYSSLIMLDSKKNGVIHTACSSLFLTMQKKQFAVKGHRI